MEALVNVVVTIAISIGSDGERDRGRVYHLKCFMCRTLPPPAQYSTLLAYAHRDLSLNQQYCMPPLLLLPSALSLFRII